MTTWKEPYDWKSEQISFGNPSESAEQGKGAVIPYWLATQASSEWACGGQGQDQCRVEQTLRGFGGEGIGLWGGWAGPSVRNISGLELGQVIFNSTEQSRVAFWRQLALAMAMKNIQVSNLVA